MNNMKNPFIQISGVCSLLAPLVLIVADLLLIVGEMMFEWTIGLWLAFVLFVPAILGLSVVLFNAGSRRLALIGGASAFFGAMAGAGMQVLFRVYAVLSEHGAEQAIELLRGTFKLIASTQMIGLFFPIGLILLAVGIYQSRIFNPTISFLPIAGAIFFPVGRIGGSTTAVSAAVFCCLRLSLLSAGTF
ncbi:MAG: hypothetical protein M3209_01745 [Acidobacteriota bacterium]|nr:hypothetical protein [Acidobacteriota bacterium]